MSLVAEARNGTSSNDAGTRSTEFKNYFTSARDLPNVTREEMLGCRSATTVKPFPPRTS